MKKIYLLMTLAVASMCFSACHQKEMEQLQREKDSLQSIVTNQDAELSTLFETLNQIEENLNLVSEKYAAAQNIKQHSLEGDNSIKAKLSAQLSGIDEVLAANKAKLAELNGKLSTLGKKNAELEAFVTKLEERVATQEAQISQLTNELNISRSTISRLENENSSLNQNVSDLTASNKRKDETIAYQVSEINKVYYIVGTFDELKEKGLVTKTGGFIGIGRRQTTTTEMDASHFTMADKTSINTININRKGVEVISKHPSNSYELIEDEASKGVVAYLRILNPTEFWKYTKFLVISTR